MAMVTIIQTEVRILHIRTQRKEKLVTKSDAQRETTENVVKESDAQRERKEQVVNESDTQKRVQRKHAASSEHDAVKKLQEREHKTKKISPICTSNVVVPAVFKP